LVSLIDVAPTILDIAGADSLPNIDGRSLVPLIRDPENVVGRDVVELVLRTVQYYYNCTLLDFL